MSAQTMNANALREAKVALFALEKQEAELSNKVIQLTTQSEHAQNRIARINKDTAHRVFAIADAFGSRSKVDRKVANDQHIVDDDTTAIAQAEAALESVRADKVRAQQRVADLTSATAHADAVTEREKHEAGFGALEASRQAFARAEEEGQRALKDSIDASWAVGSTKDRKKAADLAIAKEDVLSAAQYYEQARLNLDLPALPQAAQLQAAFDSAIRAAYSDAAVNARIKHDLVEVHFASEMVTLQEAAEIPKLQAARVAVM